MMSAFSFDRVVRAVEAVHQRLLRSTIALELAGVRCALTDDNAVAAWVAQVDESAVRNTPDVTILICRPDFENVKAAMDSAGFSPQIEAHGTSFTDKPESRRGVKFYFANEQITPGLSATHPDPTESETIGAYRVLRISTLVNIKLKTFRDRDRLNLRDLIDVGLIDQSWPARYPAELGARLQSLLDTPGG